MIVPCLDREALVPDIVSLCAMQADDLGWGDVHYNNGTAETPHLDEMAQAPGSLLLHRYYSGGEGPE